MRTTLVAVLVLSLGCAATGSGLKDSPEMRAAPEVPKMVAETIPAPESEPADPFRGFVLHAPVIAETVRYATTRVRAILPMKGTSYRSICGTPEFDYLGALFNAQWGGIETDIIMLERIAKAEGRELSDAERDMWNSAIEVTALHCGAVETICESEDSEFACYNAIGALMTASRIYAQVLAALVKGGES